MGRIQDSGFRIKAGLLVAILVGIIFTNACTVPPWVNTVESDAAVGAEIGLSLVAIVDPPLVPLVTLVDNGLNAVTSVTKTFEASPTATNLQAVQSAVGAVQANLPQLESAAQIKNAATGSEIAGVVGVLAAAIDEIAGQVPASAAAAAITGPIKTAKPHGAGYFKKQYNEFAAKDSRLKKL